LAQQDEPFELNPIRESWFRDRQIALERGVSAQEAARVAALRVFSSEPGAYGTGLLPLIDAGNWESKRDLADVFADGAGSPLTAMARPKNRPACSVPVFPR
jgi:cobaltochelatase CobN